jgi:hypothetical protein
VISGKKPYIKQTKPRGLTRQVRVSAKPGRTGRRGKAMGRFLLKLLVFLVVVGAVGLVGYAYLGDISPTQTDVSEPVNLNAD